MNRTLRNIWKRAHGGYVHMLAASVVIAGLLGVTAVFQPVVAQNNGETDTTFTVGVEVRTDEYPHDDGWSEVYTIDGVQGEELTLERGTTYYFIMDGVPDYHPFYITTDLEGAGAGQYTEGVTSTNDSYDDRAWDPDTLMFTPGDDAPDLLYYNCINHPKMGYRLNIVDPTSTDIESPVAGDELPSSFELRGNYPNPFNPTTNVRFDLPRAANVSVEIYTSLGTVVKRVEGGRMSGGVQSVQIDGSDLASGMYLYRVVATAGSSTYMGVGKMVLTK